MAIISLAWESTLRLIAIPRDTRPLVFSTTILVEVTVLGAIVQVSVRVVPVGVDATHR